MIKWSNSWAKKEEAIQSLIRFIEVNGLWTIRWFIIHYIVIYGMRRWVSEYVDLCDTSNYRRLNVLEPCHYI